MSIVKSISHRSIASPDTSLVEQLRASRFIFNGIILVAALLGCSALAVAYYATAWPQTDVAHVEFKHHAQVFFTVAANLAAIATAFTLRGPFNSRIVRAMLYVCVIHGLMMAAQFGLRLYYSRSIVFAGGLASLTLVVVVLICVERYRPQRVGVIADGLSPEQLPWLGRHAKVIESPELSARAFDIVLVNWSNSSCA